MHTDTSSSASHAPKAVRGAKEGHKTRVGGIWRLAGMKAPQEITHSPYLDIFQHHLPLCHRPALRRNSTDRLSKVTKEQRPEIFRPSHEYAAVHMQCLPLDTQHGVGSHTSPPAALGAEQQTAQIARQHPAPQVILHLDRGCSAVAAGARLRVAWV